MSLAVGTLDYVTHSGAHILVTDLHTLSNSSLLSVDTIPVTPLTDGLFHRLPNPQVSRVPALSPTTMDKVQNTSLLLHFFIYSGTED